MFDSYNRRITYLRISVTDRCNLQCRYCIPEEGVTLIPRSEILTFEEIRDFTRYAVAQGIEKVRITGGEPLVRAWLFMAARILSARSGLVVINRTRKIIHHRFGFF